MITTKEKKSRKLLTSFCISLILAVAFIGIVSAQTQEAIMALTPSSYTANVLGEEFAINLTAVNVQNLSAWKAYVTWDQNILGFVSASEGAFLKDDQGNLFSSSMSKHDGTMLNDTVEIQDSRLSNTGVSGSGVLATLIFTINSPSVDSPITLHDTVYTDPSSNEIAHQVQNAMVTFTPVGTLVANAGGDQTVNEDTLITLNASRTYPQEENLTYTWTFTDGKTISLDGMIVTYVFDIPGIYSINLTVKDLQGRTSSDSISITVRDTTLPVAIITLEGVLSNQTTKVGQQLTFSGAGSYDPENGTIVSYYWDVGSADVNDTFQLYTSGVTCEYHQPGTYNVRLTVTEDGGNNNTAMFTVTIRRANDPIDQTNLAILVAITVLVLVCSPMWLLRRRKH